MMEYKVGKMEYGKEVLGLWRYICVDWYIIYTVKLGYLDCSSNLILNWMIAFYLKFELLGYILWFLSLCFRINCNFVLISLCSNTPFLSFPNLLSPLYCFMERTFLCLCLFLQTNKIFPNLLGFAGAAAAHGHSFNAKPWIDASTHLIFSLKCLCTWQGRK